MFPLVSDVIVLSQYDDRQRAALLDFKRQLDQGFHRSPSYDSGPSRGHSSVSSGHGRSDYYEGGFARYEDYRSDYGYRQRDYPPMVVTRRRTTETGLVIYLSCRLFRALLFPVAARPLRSA